MEAEQQAQEQIVQKLVEERNKKIQEAKDLEDKTTTALIAAQKQPVQVFCEQPTARDANGRHGHGGCFNYTFFPRSHCDQVGGPERVLWNCKWGNQKGKHNGPACKQY